MYIKKYGYLYAYFYYLYDISDLNYYLNHKYKSGFLLGKAYDLLRIKKWDCFKGIHDKSPQVLPLNIHQQTPALSMAMLHNHFRPPPWPAPMLDLMNLWCLLSIVLYWSYNCWGWWKISYLREGIFTWFNGYLGKDNSWCWEIRW